VIELRQVRITDPHAVLLIEQVQAEYVVRYGGPDETPIDPTMFDPPSGSFFVGYDGEEPVAMGGWKRRTDVTAFGRSDAAEIKRMYVVASARGRGIARAVLAHLESTASAAGADLMILETGVKQPEAIALYESSGYAPIDGFGHYAQHPNARHFGKAL
jgi:GNAT superfamily N-acetyltransferase